MEGLKQKYEDFKNLYLNNFVGLISYAEGNGANIPLSYIIEKTGYSDDGTINLASDIAWRIVSKKENDVISDVKAVRRLSDACFQMYKNKVGEVTSMTKQDGFFMRDDITKQGWECYELEKIHSGNQMDTEDPCYSWFMSQDQVWHLVPMLVAAYRFYLSVDNDAGLFVRYILKYVMDCKHIIKHPYRSAILYDWTFTNPKVYYNDRINDRRNKFTINKMKVNVKRGANNIYFAWLFRKVAHSFGVKGNFKTFLYSLWQIPMLELAHWTFFPVLRKVQKSWDREYPLYSMRIAAGATKWMKRYAKKFVSELKKGNLFMPDMLALVPDKYFSCVTGDLLQSALTAYSNIEGNRIKSPIDFLTVYDRFSNLINATKI